MKLENQTAIITGAGAGIGRACAIRFAQEGAKVAVADINRENGEKVVEEIRAQGGRAIFCPCNVMDQAQVEQMAETVMRELGPVDILINNAGGAIVGGKHQDFEDCTREYIDTLIGINLMGSIFCTRAVIGGMKARRYGRIINLSSIRGVAGDKNEILYGTAKGGIISFTKGLAMRMGEYGITVNAIAPGAIASRPGPAAQVNFLGHPGKCEDVAALALFLASEEGSFITGETVTIDGGRTCGCRGD